MYCTDTCKKCANLQCVIQLVFVDPAIQWVHPAAHKVSSDHSRIYHRVGMMSGVDTAGPSDQIYAVLYLMMSGVKSHCRINIFPPY